MPHASEKIPLPYFTHCNAEVHAYNIAEAVLYAAQLAAPSARRPCWRASYYHATHTPRGGLTGWIAWDEGAEAMMFYPEHAIAIQDFNNENIRFPLQRARIKPARASAG